MFGEHSTQTLVDIYNRLGLKLTFHQYVSILAKLAESLSRIKYNLFMLTLFSG